MARTMPSFYEFFAGGGMARAGLGKGWTCLFANDFDAKKGLTYQRNYPGGNVLRVGDVREIKAADLPGHADLIWGSFPCQDLSLAGGGAGLKGERSGTFYPFWDIVKGVVADGRGPKAYRSGKRPRDANLARRARLRGDLQDLCRRRLSIRRPCHQRRPVRAAVAASPVHCRRARRRRDQPRPALAGADRAVPHRCPTASFRAREQEPPRRRWFGGTCPRPRGATPLSPT